MTRQHIFQGVALAHLDVLRDVCDALGARRLDGPGLDAQLTLDRGEQTRLAAAVGADQSDALTGPRDQGGTAIQRPHAARQRDIDQPQHRWSSWIVMLEVQQASAGRAVLRARC